MAKIRAGQSQKEQDDHDLVELPSGMMGQRPKLPQRLPAALGQIHEIDLGPDAVLRNVARTEAAAKRMQNGESAADEQPAERVRLGRDGKPRRRRNRRGSDDIKRDQIVEAVLKESRCNKHPTSPDCSYQDHDSDVCSQWIYTTSRKMRTRMTTTTKRRTTLLLSSSDATSWTPCNHATVFAELRPPRLRRSQALRWRRSRGAPNLEGVGVLGRQCMLSRRWRRSDECFCLGYTESLKELMTMTKGLMHNS